MSPLLRISFRLIVVQFFKRNAGLFFFFFIVFFGIIPPRHLLSTHLALIYAQIDSALFTLLVFIFWSGYSIRCSSFIQKIVLKYWDSTTYHFTTFSNQSLFLVLLVIFSCIFLPVLLYGMVVAAVAFKEGVIIYGVYVLASLLLITIANVMYTNRIFYGRKTSFTPTLTLKKLFPEGRDFNFNWLLLGYFWHEKRNIIFLMKITSYVGFNLFIIRNSEFFRADYFSIFLLFIGSLSSLLIFSGQKFLEEHAQFLRNLPLSISRRGTMILVTGMVYFIPELLFLIGMSHETLTHQSKLIYYLLLISQFVLLFSLLYSENFGFWKYVKYIFIMLIGYQILNALIPLYIVIAINFILSYVIFNDAYLKYEHEIPLMKE